MTINLFDLIHFNFLTGWEEISNVMKNIWQILNQQINNKIIAINENSTCCVILYDGLKSPIQLFLVAFC